MNLTSWLKFVWDVRNFQAPPHDLPAHYAVRRAVRSEEEIVRKAIFSTFSLDSDWNDSFNIIWPTLNTQIGETFDAKEPKSLVLTHGTRIIGASILAAEADAEISIVSGPCILAEYRNRGLGTALLAASLAFLSESGLETACAITKKNITVSKFVYPKLGGKSEPYDSATLAANS